MSAVEPTHGLRTEIVPSGSTVRHTSYLRSVDRGLLRLEMTARLTPGDTVTVRIGQGCFPGQVVYAVAEGGFFRTAVQVLRKGKANRRKERRVPVRWSGSVTVLSRAMATVPAEVTDVSSFGFAMRSPCALHPGDLIALQTDTCIAFGEVAHCTAAPDGAHRSGVLLTELFETDEALPSSDSNAKLHRWLKRMARRPGR